jgi:predicted DCC family thiol-disulfide oxidoreductase YuxK
MKHLIVLYDGHCVFCDFWVHQICKWDKNDRIRFTNLESSYAKSFYKQQNLNKETFDSIIVWDQVSEYGVEAEAVFIILREIKGWIKILIIFSILPADFTNAIYRLIAKLRYKVLKKKTCTLPPPHIKFTHKFYQ